MQKPRFKFRLGWRKHIPWPCRLDRQNGTVWWSALKVGRLLVSSAQSDLAEDSATETLPDKVLDYGDILTDA
jgi:hypothetical protein